jgi:hypothetical protein
MMRNLFMLFFLGGCMLANAQVAVNTDGTPPDNSAMLDVKSNNHGALLPRMTQAQIAAIPSPANGLVVFCTTDNKFYTYLSSDNKWKEIVYGPGTITQFSCGSSFTIDHVAGAVSPVSKTVTYGTVTNIPGEPAKCWITSNLGADHQATSMDDATEASAGWYWQFNLRQGYKHDGFYRTPDTTWIAPINENSDWVATNDPCNIELGTTWRIPTNTEWYNVDNAGGWTSWTGPWGSGLKLHAAGNLSYNAGLLYGRGTYGFNWSSTQFDAAFGWYLVFYSGYSFMYNYDKANGFSIRCVRD